MRETHYGFRGTFYFYKMSKIKITTEQFIFKAKEIHGDKYDYSKTIYTGSRNSIIIICKKHGEFKQNSNNHLNGKGCKKCTFKYNNEIEFINEARKIHKNFYKYHKVDFKNTITDVIITCPLHGDFKQRPSNHISGKGCLKCGHNKTGKGNFKTLKWFIEKAKRIHKRKYDYSQSHYDGILYKTKIICKKHGIFFQTPNEHLSGKGCPKCISIISKPEMELQEFVKSLEYVIETNKRNIIKPYELDIFIPELNKAIEFNGLYWHYSEKYFEAGKHAKKSNLCKEKNIKLLHIREELWLKDKEKMKKVITKFLTKF
jgi:hypothetical protein